jgi:demethylmenaquinone methyltransferase/2-methoxy-6-polyprenyl-1,4-benzoquinol methylase
LTDRSRLAAPPQAGFHASFNCLWCGQPHTTRTPDDLEGWAQLCSSCVGRAQDNEFLRYRLRDGLRRRTEATEARRADNQALKDYYAARAPEYDEFYVGDWRSPLDRAVFDADLDAATLWLDDLPINGEIVELAAGTGWWSPLLAQKGELSLYDVSDEVLVRARDRLVAHGLRAHIHVRDAWAEPDRKVDAVFCGAWLSHVRRNRLPEFLAVVRRWLKPSGIFAFIDEAGQPGYTPIVDEHQARELKDGRQFEIVKIYYEPDELEAALRDAGFAQVEVKTTSRYFLLGRASAE